MPSISQGIRAEGPEVRIRTSGHIPVLDGLRGVAILMVLIGHFYRKSFISEAYPGTVTNIVGRIVGMNGFGVELFFVLSGFLITGILLDTRHEEGFFRKFYMRRILRIFPLYYGALAVVLFIVPLIVQFDEGARRIAAHQVWLWTYLVNYPTSGWIWDDSQLFSLGHFWSLAVEEHFYLVWPAVVALVSRRGLYAVCASLIGVGIACRLLIALLGTDAPTFFQWTTLQKLDGLVIGALLAAVLRDASFAPLLPTGRGFRWMFGTAGVVLLIYVWMPRTWQTPAMSVFTELLVAFFFGLLLLQALRLQHPQALHRLFTTRLLMMFGKYSYGLYVIHGILRPCFERVFDPAGYSQRFGLPFFYLLVYWLLTISISFVLAYMSYQFFEKRFLALKSHFEYTRRASRSSARIPDVQVTP